MYTLINTMRDAMQWVRNRTEDVWRITSIAVQVMMNPNLGLAFFTGGWDKRLPHVRGSTPLGLLGFRRESTLALTKAANSSPQGVATGWVGPWPVVYITSNDTRLKVILEERLGIVDERSAEFLKWLSNNNQIMGTFPAFRAIHSDIYDVERKFLLKRFHGGAKQRLADIEKATTAFLKAYSEQQGDRPVRLRQLLTLLVLHTSSHLLGLTQSTLDTLYNIPAFQEAIDSVALNGISQRANPALQDALYLLFLKTLEDNFTVIQASTAETNYIQHLFAALGQPFPASFADFHQLPADFRREIAMNFASTGLGAMVHSTANTLDWAVARLIKDKTKCDKLTELMANQANLDLTQESLFDKNGRLFPIGEWVLHTVYLYPPFAHQFFPNATAFDVELADNFTINIPANSFVVVNYGECNRSNEAMHSATTFADNLSEESTTGRFIMNPDVASFGGSRGDKTFKKSRICPGAKTSLLEQMIMIARILKDYSLTVSEGSEISVEPDPQMHPLCVRKNEGEVVLTNNTCRVGKAERAHQDLESSAELVGTSLRAFTHPTVCSRDAFFQPAQNNFGVGSQPLITPINCMT